VCGAEKEQFKVDPQPLNLSLITQIKQVACGIAHALIVDQRGLLYSIGSNEYGQLGINNLEVPFMTEPSIIS
jgi:E3 ubiquitin-protein ligase MYCBP2